MLSAASISRPRRRATRAARGFTLVEMMIATTIFAMLAGMIIGFYTDSFRSMFITEQRNQINDDMRKLTSSMTYDARDANFFVLYANYTASSRASASQELLEGNSGDFLVLVSYGTPPNSAKFNIRPVSEIIGYYRAPYQSSQLSTDPITNEPANVMPVRRFDLSVANNTLAANQYLLATGSSDLPSGGTATTLEALLPNDNATTIASHPIVVQLAQGLDDGLLFHNFWGKSIMINGKIMHGNNDVSATDTYNFTVSPRG